MSASCGITLKIQIHASASNINGYLLFKDLSWELNSQFYLVDQKISPNAHYNFSKISACPQLCPEVGNVNSTWHTVGGFALLTNKAVTVMHINHSSPLISVKVSCLRTKLWQWHESKQLALRGAAICPWKKHLFTTRGWNNSSSQGSCQKPGGPTASFPLKKQWNFFFF